MLKQAPMTMNNIPGFLKKNEVFETTLGDRGQKHPAFIGRRILSGIFFEYPGYLSPCLRNIPGCNLIDDLMIYGKIVMNDLVS